MTEEKYVLTRSELLSLLFDQEELDSLNAAGVDNWSSYGDNYMFHDHQKMMGQDISEEECKAIQDEVLSRYKKEGISDD